MIGKNCSISLTDRDERVLRGLFASRFLTLSQVADIYYIGRYPSAKRRVAKLKQLGLIQELKRRRYQPSVLYLTQRGFELSRERRLLRGYPDLSWKKLLRRRRISERTLAHELEVIDVKVAFVKALNRLPDLSILEFTTWPKLCEFSARRPVETGDYNFGTKLVVKDALLRPDGFIHIQQNEHSHYLYLELDRSTETQHTLVSKAIGYWNHFQNGGLAQRFGAHSSSFKSYPFRVLIVVKTQERRNNLLERLIHCSKPVNGMIWVATLKELKEGPLDAIWINPRSYLIGLKGTAFDPSKSSDQFVYIRRVEREQLVAEVVSKLKLFRF